MSWRDSLPEGVKAHGDSGIYWVSSRSRPQSRHRVDVCQMYCSCEIACKGDGAKARKALGYLPFQYFCRHLVAAVMYDGMMLRGMLEDSQRPIAKTKFI